MKRLVKILFAIIASLMALAVIAAVAVTLFVDPNDYRDTIASKVQQQTGRELAIDGEIKLSLFPWLGLELGAVTLGNAEGFAGKPFARIEAAEARVKLLPLLKLQTEIDTVLLRGLVLNLHRRADGVSNWDDLAKAESAPTSEASTAPEEKAKPANDEKKLEQVLAALAIGGIALEEANVDWQDDPNGQHLALKHFNFSAGAIRIGEAIPLTLSTELLSSAPDVNGTMQFNGDVTADPLSQRYRAEGVRLQLELMGKAIPGGEMKAQLAGNVSADLKQQQASLSDFSVKGMGAELGAQLEVSKLLSQPDVQGRITASLSEVKKLLALLPKETLPPELTLTALNESQLQAEVALSLGEQTVSLKPLTLSAAGVTLTLTAQGQQIIDSPSFSGKLSSNEFVPRQLLQDLGIALPEMADPAVMGKAKFGTRFSAGLDKVALNDLSLKLDATTFGGQLSVSRFKAPVIRYTLNLDTINVDRYLPPPGEGGKGKEGVVSPGGAAAATASTALPLDLLRSLDIDGSLNVGKVKVMNLHSDTIVTTLKARQGKFRVHPLSANLYQGAYSGNLGFDVSGETPRLEMDEKLSGVQAGPLLKDFMGKPYVTGEANLAAKMTAKGIEPVAIRKTLNGNGSFKFANGTVNGVNIGHLIRMAYATYKKQPKPKEESRSTDFANLSGSFQVKNGLVSTRDISARSPLFQVDGKGTTDLVKEKLDLRLDTTIVSDIRDATGENMGDLRGEKIPVTIKGSFSDPEFGVDVGSLLEAKAKAELEKKKKAAEKEINKKLDAEKKKLENELQDKLKNMLKF